MTVKHYLHFWIPSSEKQEFEEIFRDLGRENDGGIVIKQSNSQLLLSENSPPREFPENELLKATYVILNADEFRTERETHQIATKIMKRIASEINIYLLVITNGLHEALTDIYRSYFVEDRPTHFTSVNYFGDEVSNRIGKELLETAPAYEICEMNDGYVLQALETYDDWPTSQRRKDLEKHLEMRFM